MEAAVVVCIRNKPAQRPPGETPSLDRVDSRGFLHPTRQTTNPRRHETDAASRTEDAPGYRRWPVSITVNGSEPTSAVICDPFREEQYTIFDRYLRDSDRPQWRLQPGNTADATDAYGMALDRTSAEKEMQLYAVVLFNQFEGLLRRYQSGVTRCQIYVVEGYDDSDVLSPDGQGGIHCLAWELLESLGLPSVQMNITRVSDFPEPRSVSSGSTAAPQAIKAPRSVSAVHEGDPFVKVLLVVARDFSRTGAERDPEPDLAQFPLMSLHRRLRGRMLLEVVRPGSREELDVHLRKRAEQGVHFHLVHFDLHGRIRRDQNGNEEPCLLFAKRHHIGFDSRHDVPQTNLARAELVAQMLVEHGVKNVVLNACLSAYNRRGPGTNLAHIFLRHGIRNVSAMWYYVHWQTVSTYLETFYNELLTKRTNFHIAAHRGREAIRKNPTTRTGLSYHDFFLCVNYSRESHPVDGSRGASNSNGNEKGAGREPSPSPSVQSQDSSASNHSFKSMLKAASPRLGDNLAAAALAGGDAPMRMKLHLLELEYKLTTFRIVYASDLRRADSELGETIDRMASMWLDTNLVDAVYYYKGKDFAKRKILSGHVSYREKRTRLSGAGLVGLPRKSGFGSGWSGSGSGTIKALRQTLHVIRDLDSIVDPGFQANEEENKRSDRRRDTAAHNLERFAQRLHEERDSYLLFVGSQDMQWWRTYLEHLDGEWWLHMPWSFTVQSRHARDLRLTGDGDRRALTPSPLGIH